MRVKTIKLLTREAEKFLGDAKLEKDDFIKAMYIKSAIAFSWFGLEGFVNLALADFLSLENLETHEKAFIEEKNVEFSKGEFIIKGTRYYPTRDKIIFLLKRFGNHEIRANDPLLIKLRNLEDWRDALVHPKEQSNIVELTLKQATITLDTTKSIINLVYQKVYKKSLKS